MAESSQAPAARTPITTRIGQAVILHRGGDREEARNRLAALWEELGERGAPAHRCTVAHYLAGTQDDPREAVLWDLRALAAADALASGTAPGDAAPGSGRPSAGTVGRASLLLSLASDHARLGDRTAARRELERARSAAAELPATDHALRVRTAVGRLDRLLAGDEGGRGPSADPQP